MGVFAKLSSPTIYRTVYEPLDDPERGPARFVSLLHRNLQKERLEVGIGLQCLTTAPLLSSFTISVPGEDL